MPKDIKEYIIALRKYNPGVLDAEIKSYLMGLGYNQSEIENNLVTSNTIPNVITTEQKKETVADTNILSGKQALKSILPEVAEEHHLTVTQNTQSQTFDTNLNIKKEERLLSVDEVKQVAKSINEQIDKIADKHNLKIPDDFNQVQISQDVVVPKPITAFSGTFSNTINENQSKAPVITENIQSNVSVETIQTEVVPKSTNKKTKFVFLVVILIIFSAFLAYVYLFKQEWFRKAPYTQQNFIKSLVGNILKIDNTNYSTSFSVRVSPREADVKEYVPGEEVKKLIEVSKRDDNRLKDIGIILEKLQTDFISTKKFPASLNNLKDIKIEDPEGNKYEYKLREGESAGFRLSFLLESGDVQNLVKEYGFIFEDNKVIADENTTFYSSLGVNNVSLSSYILQNKIGLLPNDLNLSFGVSGLYDRNQSNNIRFGINGSYVGGDFNTAFDVEATKFEKDIYFKINKAPSLFGDLASVKLQWIKVTGQDVASKWFSFMSRENINRLNDKTYADQIKKILEVADETALVTYKGNPIVKKENGELFYEYDIDISKDAFVEFYKKITKELLLINKDNPIIVYDAFTENRIKSSLFREIWDYFSQNQKILLTVDSKGIPVSLDYMSRIAGTSDSQKVSDKQINISFGLKLSETNSNIIVEAPKDAVSFKEAYLKFTGQTEEEYDVANQINGINSVRQALEEYKFAKGLYPESLNKLTEVLDNEKKGKKILDALPKDEYTKKDFVYVLDKDLGFKLTYSIILPQKLDSKKDISIYKTTGYSVATSGAKKYLITGLKYVNGQNTLTSGYDSLEAVKDLKVDFDKDGLSDSFEVITGTDPKKKN